jgi:hypothetical protein
MAIETRMKMRKEKESRRGETLGGMQIGRVEDKKSKE